MAKELGTIMEDKQINLSKSYIYGFFAAMICTLIYSAVIIPIYILLISSNPQNFFVYLLYALDVWVWIWIGISILYAFIIVMMQPTKKYTSLSKTIENLLFFIVTSVILILSLSYVPEIQKLLYKKDYTFYSTILAVGLFFISIQLSYCIKKFIIFMYKTILYNLGYTIEDEIIDDDEDEYKTENYEVIKINKSEYEIFSSTIKNIIAFSQRYKHAIGIIAFKISNSNSIIDEYGNSAYRKLQDELIKAIKKNARIGENQCLLYDNIIYSVIFANEDEAWKATKRYFKALKNYNFEYNGESVDINVSMAVSGFDFSSNRSNKMSVYVVKDSMMRKIKDALNESEETGSPVIYYE
ncbi:hypothetical protein Q5M87_06035 [Brachyspira innocens]|uniref:Diguanylate cyclase n=2 Tax=Brachyspira innocens TaxID=13264 RepID=A0ABT8YW91_9SPIR|nr:hypothetical protein [Brachyspira innocens]MDO6993567.1 hypothetical protein [Brachyspira innocens]MDO7019487.1 hypothetical protein [Brachyspira innocens]